MSVSRTRHAFALVSFLAASIAAPLAPALAASATVDFGVVHAPATGVYDGEDKYRDANGFPLPGWDYLFFPPS